MEISQYLQDGTSQIQLRISKERINDKELPSQNISCICF